MAITVSDLEWLLNEAKRIVLAAKHTNNEGMPMYFPEGGETYPAMFTRDLFYMYSAAPELFNDEEIEKIYFYIIKRQHPNGHIPDLIDIKGNATYLIIGKNPPTDNTQFLIQLCYALVMRTDEIGIFEATENSLERAMLSIPTSPNSGLVWIDPSNPHSSYGFTDIVKKIGEELFSSLLYYDAAKKLTELFQITGKKDKAQEFKNKANKIKQDIAVFWNSEYSLLNAATIEGTQPDIWGNAYAVYVGILPKDIEGKVCKSLAKLLPRYAKRGQIRHILEGTTWQGFLTNVREYREDPNGKLCPHIKELARENAYQNGAYWATPVSWVAYALEKVDRTLAEKLYTELIADFRTNGIYECVNDGYTKCRDYVISATNPITGLKRLLET